MILSGKRRSTAFVLLGGSPDGLSAKKVVDVDLDFQIHYDTDMGVADFNGDGKPGLACFGHSHRTVPSVFIWLQP